ncbi:peptidase M17 [Pedobacter sp. KBW06]|nr:peptidase M17 [Pedobacter sp. KBW06]
MIISSCEQLDNYSFPASFSEKTHHILESPGYDVLTTLGAHKTIFVISSEKEVETWRLIGASLYKILKKERISFAQLKELRTLSLENRRALFEGLLLASYCFSKHKENLKQDKILIYVSGSVFPGAELQELHLLNEAITLTKNLVNEPLNHLDALKLSEVIVQAGKEFGFETEILHEQEIIQLRMGGLLAVNKGSETPPTFNVLEYRPANAVNVRPLVLVGKGIMFDTGGYSLKTGGSMVTMKCDMAGGAAVLGIIAAIASNKLPYYVVGLIPATDNKISASALVVDDIITMMDGTTVEIQNTDAEGRLVLADALTYARRFDPELVIDIATLTGAAAAITGYYGIAMAGNHQQKMDKLKQSGEAVHERLFQLPLWKEFGELLNSETADLRNIGGPIGGASTASKFLEHFTSYDWIHLDIAGAAYIKKHIGYKQSGGTASGVRLLYEFTKQQIKEEIEIKKTNEHD